MLPECELQVTVTAGSVDVESVATVTASSAAAAQVEEAARELAAKPPTALADSLGLGAVIGTATFSATDATASRPVPAPPPPPPSSNGGDSVFDAVTVGIIASAVGGAAALAVLGVVIFRRCQTKSGGGFEHASGLNFDATPKKTKVAKITIEKNDGHWSANTQPPMTHIAV